jgi:two-component system catabolic regulation response regulator CreB
VLRRTQTDTPATAAVASGGTQAGDEGSAARGPFRVDETRCEVNYHGTVLVLTRREYRLLLALLDQPGRVFTREQLLARAWDEPEASLDRTVDAHVKTLRAKLRTAHADTDPIRTHRGFGYSLHLE